MKIPMSEKSAAMRAAIEGLFPGTASAISKRQCPLCKKPVGDFADAISLREFEISGMCQSCQDEVFR